MNQEERKRYEEETNTGRICQGYKLLSKKIVEQFCPPALNSFFLHLFKKKHGRSFDPEEYDGKALFDDEIIHETKGYIQNCLTFNEGQRLRVNEYLVSNCFLRKFPFLLWASFFLCTRSYKHSLVDKKRLLYLISTLVQVRNGVYKQRRVQDGGGITEDTLDEVFCLVKELLDETGCCTERTEDLLLATFEIKAQMIQSTTREVECARLKEYFDNNESWLKAKAQEAAKEDRYNGRVVPNVVVPSSAFIDRPEVPSSESDSDQ